MLNRTAGAQALGAAAAERFRELAERSPYFWELDGLAANRAAAAEQLRHFCDYLAEQGRSARATARLRRLAQPVLSRGRRSQYLANRSGAHPRLTVVETA